MQRLKVSGAVRPIYGSLGVKRLIDQVTTISGRQRSQSYNHTDKENGDMAMIPVNRPEDCQLTGRNM